MRYLKLICIIFPLLSYALETVKEIETDPYLFTPVALSNYEYYLAHPNNFELQESMLAFPSAEGFGKYTTGGRGGTIIHVTNLNDTGAGSFREAVTTAGPRTIVFDVGGDIKINSLIQIGSGNFNSDPAVTSDPFENITISGETAPFPGITIRSGVTDENDFGALVSVKTSNVIIRYLSFRTDDGDISAMDALQVANPWKQGNPGPYLKQLQNVIIDHVSVSNGSDENFAIEGVSNVTVQNSMFTDSDHSGYNILFGISVFNSSFIGNYLSHTSYRNPLVGYGLYGETSEWINNIVFGYKVGGTDVVWGNNTDVIGNLYKAWNNVPPTAFSVKWDHNSFNNPDAVVTDGGIYVADNLQANPAKHDFALYSNNVINNAKPTRRLTNSLITTWATDSTSIKNRVFNSNIGSNGVGNSLFRDAFDQAAIDDYNNDANERRLVTLIPDKVATSRPANYDTDGDGMEDAWEIDMYGDLTKTANGFDDITGYETIQGSGINTYTNFQKFSFFFTEEVQISGSPSTPTNAIQKKKYIPWW